MSDSIPTIELRGTLWTLKATAPEFREKTKPVGSIHSLRTLMIDVRSSQHSSTIDDKTEFLTWRLPRLMSLHLVAGSKKFKGDFAGDEEFAVDFGQFDFDKNDFLTSDSDTATGGGLQQVVAEPILDASDNWPNPSLTNLSAPPMRLVAGAIEITAKTKDVSWLGGLPRDGAKRVVLRLTPDGIELDSQAPLPGFGTKQGRFLLTQTSRGIRLRLLPDRLSDADKKTWHDAWLQILRPEAAKNVAGLEIDARHELLPPAFEWPIVVSKDGIEDLAEVVEIPAADLNVRLLSPRDSHGVIDGEVAISPDFYQLSKSANDFLLRATIAKPAAITPSTRLVLRADRNGVNVKLEGFSDPEKCAHICAHDELALARDLRAAQGIDDPQPGKNDVGRPLLAAFVPLDDGWLQFPVPNVPPRDASQDKDVLASVAPTPRNVLSGYLRYATRGTIPNVLSAFGGDPFKVDEAPWVVTVDGALGLDVLIGLEISGGHLDPVSGSVAIDGPQLSTRGLVWISSDRPDALEALPRLGAGAGQFLDIPLDTFDIETKPTLQFTIEKLEILVDHMQKNDAVSRDSLRLAVDFNTDGTAWKQIIKDEKHADEIQRTLDDAHVALDGAPAGVKPMPPVLWQRHPQMPLAAAMPMTRGADSAVRPLESRDFVPWIVATTGTSLVEFAWKKSAVFPHVLGADEKEPLLRPAAKWPLPKNETQAAEGIALVAFGVPGAELAFAAKKIDADTLIIDDTSSRQPWLRLRNALRHDLPLLDEAFATATLPPTPPEDTLPEERELLPAPPVPLAYDWPAITAFWREQNRRHQLARVAHSYLSAYGSATRKDDVLNLVGDAKWNVDPLGFVAPGENDGDPLPYGHAVIGAETFKGNNALRGIDDKTFGLKDDVLSLPPANGSDLITVTGNAPASYTDANGFLIDSRRAGTRPLRKIDDIYWREIRVGKATAVVTGLATLAEPMGISDRFDFWFKDLPLTNGVFAQKNDLDFAAWQDGVLPRSGFEWRLVPRMDAQSVFEAGRQLIPFFGFELEPLRLQGCEVTITANAAAVKTIEILARLHLGPHRNGPATDGNLVVLHIKDGVITSLTASAPLVFTFDAMTTEGTLRRIGLSGTPRWDVQRPMFDVTALTVSMFGADLHFDGVSVNVPQDIGQQLTIQWANPNPAFTVSPGQGVFVVQSIAIDPNVEAARIRMKRQLQITPRAEGGATLALTRAAFTLTLDDATSTDTLQLLDLSIVLPQSPDKQRALRELDGALAVVVSNQHVEGALLPGFPINGNLSLGLGGSLELSTATSRKVDLFAGYLDGDIACESVDSRIDIRRVSLHAERLRRIARGETGSADWLGALSIDGRIAIASAIGWPEIVDGNAIEPVPENVKDGHSDIRINAGKRRIDNVEYALEGHSLPFDVAEGIREGVANAVWAVPVVARHTLTSNVDNVSPVIFIGIETIAIGAAAAIIPPLGAKNIAKPEKSYAEDPLTWAPRHRDNVDKKIIHGFPFAGIGHIATVLSGVLGVSFRASFQAGAQPRLFLAGGFVGMIGVSDGEKAPLLRLPVLAAIDPGDDFARPGFIAQTGNALVQVSWPDGRAALDVIATLRSAVTPASASDASLRRALLAGSRAELTKDATPEETATAILVEQTFDTSSENPTPGDLQTTPFFIGAAVRVSRALAVLPATPPADLPVLSLISGWRLAHSKTSGLAAAMITRSLPFDDADPISASVLRSELATIGDDLVVHPWNGPALADLGDIPPVGLVSGPAFADHTTPRVAIIRTSTDGQTSYDAPSLPRRRERPRAANRPLSRAFDDIGRGYALLPENPGAWLAGIEEGVMQPYRDAKGETSSGLAGLSRPVAMTSYAADLEQVFPAKEDETSDPALRGLVWLSQTRAPIYLPLTFMQVHSPAVPWLAPGSPRPRVPADAVVAEALTKLGFKKNEGTNRFDLAQPIVPERATVASVGDRAGISLARVARLETSLGGVPAFDSRYSRFGRPAQGGSSSVRTERTPRPGPIPPNTGDEVRDRRPCASPLLPFTPLSALIGPADTVRGEANDVIGRWSVTFVAAPQWEGMITESWDGTIPLLAEIDIEREITAPKPASVVKSLFGLLFPNQAGDALASLVIGGAVVPFVRMHVQEPTPPAIFAELPDSKKVIGDKTFVVDRGVARLVLDARPNDPSTARGSALGAIANAFAGAALPPVEIHFVVHPSSRPPASGVTTPLLLAKEPAKIPNGDDRAPVTLRIPLAPVVRSRGALPLAPTSLLFTDPAYDTGLSSAPAEDHGRVHAPGVQLPESRGALALTLYADRGGINRRSSVTFMIDLAYERKLDAKGAAPFVGVDGDLIKADQAMFDLTIAVIPKSGDRRDLFVGKPAPSPVAGFVPPPPPKIGLATVCELALSTLVEKDGTAAALVAGDVLELRVAEKSAGQTRVIVVGASSTTPITINTLDEVAVMRRLLIVLTDEPVVEPPPALYAALVRRELSNVALSLPLYAQSPLPWRVDLRDPKRDFRRGVVRRTATFIWTLARPSSERPSTRLYVVKSDRNGQIFLPSENDFLKARDAGEVD